MAHSIRRKISTLARLWVVAALVGLPVNAGEYWVDAAHGDDANTGDTTGSAWRTISHALSSLPVPATGLVERIHVAPGVYDAALGEVFPLRLADHDAVQIVGTGGAAVTILDGGGTGTLVDDVPQPLTGGHTGPLTLVQGLTLRNASEGIRVSCIRLQRTDLTCRDLTISRITGQAVTAIAEFGFAAGFDLRLNLDRVEVVRCREGVLLGMVSVNHTFVTLTDCRIVSCAGTGILVADRVSTSLASHLSLLRSRVARNGGDGIRIESQSTNEPTTVDVADCTITANRGSGVKIVRPAEVNSWITTSIVRCTIADNLVSGVDSNIGTSAVPGTYHTRLESTILFGNGDDVVDNALLPTISPVESCDIGDGDFAGILGNISANPLFRSASTDDYRLTWNSPCVDAGSATTPIGELDHDRVPRPIDGDLDTVEIADIGALEFAPLWTSPTARVGQDVIIEQWGPSGGTATLLVARGGPLAMPLSTPFGEVDLNLGAVRDLGAQPVASGPPALRVLHVPDDPSYIGLRVTFQALATASVSTPPQAYTNPVTVTIVP